MTDGWYAVAAMLDLPLSGLVRSGRIYVGLKLCIAGAELVGQEAACSPLEVSPQNLKKKRPDVATMRNVHVECAIREVSNSTRVLSRFQDI